MGDWSLAAGLRSESSAAGTIGGAQVSADASADTKGAWTGMIAATGFDVAAIMVTSRSGFATHDHLIDIGVGASGSEQILVPDLLMASAIRLGTPVVFPVAVPAGSRVSARVATSVGGGSINISVNLLSGAFPNMPAMSKVDTYGTNVTGSDGTFVDSGATVDTKGAWTQIVASTARAHKGFVIAATSSDQSTTLAGNHSHVMDLGVGAAGSEQVMLADVVFFSGSLTETWFPQYIPAFPCDVPAGSRLAIRMLSTTTNTVQRAARFAVYGLS